MRKIKSILLIALCTTMCFVAKSQEVLKVGETFSGFALKSTTGQVVTLSANKKAKGYILVFMTPTCDHCILYEPRVKALDKKYKALGYPVVAVGPYGDNQEKYPLDAMAAMKKLAETKKFTFPYVSDQAFKYTWLLGIEATPTAVVLKKTNKGFLIVYKGNIDDQENPAVKPKHKFVEEAVNRLLK